MDVLKYTVLDDTTHIIGPGEYTVCQLAIPFGNGYTKDEPKKLCGDCAKRTKDTDEFGVARDVQAEAAPDLPFAAPEPAPMVAAKEAKPAKAKSGDKA